MSIPVWDMSISVSYTHLDVYKRQGQARGGRQPQPVPPKGTGAPQKPLVQPQEQEPDFTPEAVIPNKTDKEKENDGESKL